MRVKKKDILTPQKAEKIQAEIYRQMPAERKLKISSQFILLARKLKKAKTIKR